MPFLATDAAAALLAVERDTDGLVYTDMWRDPVASLLARRIRRTGQLPGYSGHNYGLSVDLDLRLILKEKQIHYEDLLHMMKRRGWICQRRDGDGERPEAEHFNFLGEYADKYLAKCTLDPTTWQNAMDIRIYEKYGREFQIPMKDIQERLSRVGLYFGPFSGQSDMYTREAILAFQRTWDLIPNGHADATTARVLVFVTADITMIRTH